MQRFPEAENLQAYLHSLRFNIRIRGLRGSEPKESSQDNDRSVLLESLFGELMSLGQDYKADGVRFSLTKCKLDTAFQRILETPSSMADKSRLVTDVDVAQRSVEGGYVHEGYVETEMII